MTNEIDDGGPAFPQNSNDPYRKHTEGMSLRDWFAGQALAGLLASSHQQNLIAAGAQSYQQTIDDCAVESYQFADAVIARKNPKTDIAADGDSG